MLLIAAATEIIYIDIHHLGWIPYRKHRLILSGHRAIYLNNNDFKIAAGNIIARGIILLQNSS